MSHRRFAEDQPGSFAFTPENEVLCQSWIKKYPAGKQQSAVIPLLMIAQQQNGGWLPRPAVELVSKMLDIPPINVLEIATFYTMFNLSPVGEHFVQVCGTTPCMLRGSQGIMAICAKRIGQARHVREDGLFSWQEVECLGACVNAPVVQINGLNFEDLTPESFTRLLDCLERGKEVRPGPQCGRVSCEPFVRED